MTPQELKNSILQRAIQGKLVEQRPEEGTGEELYQKIQAEKRRLIKEKKIKKEKPLPEIKEEEIPFAIPDNWKWVRLRDVVYNREQQIPKGKFSYIDIGSIDNRNQSLSGNECVLEASNAPLRARKLVEQGDILYSTVRPYLHNMCIVDRKFSYQAIASTGFAAMVCFNGICNKYLFYFLLSPAFDHYANDVENAKGVAYPAINDGRLYRAVVPLPPLAEQCRIVAKIEELLPYIDRYAAAWNRLEELNRRFPADIRKSLLQMAIQGKLVEQRPEEGSGDQLYQRIQAEKRHLIKEKKLKKEKPLPEIKEEEIPFDIPDNWKWVRLLNVVSITSNLVQPKKYLDYMHIAPDNIEKATGRLLICRTVRQDEVISPNHLFTKGQILYSKIRPLLRKAVIAPFDGLCSADMYPLATEINSGYVFYYLLSDVFNQQLAKAMSSRVKMPKVNRQELSQIIIPLPPLAEQRRIVAKLEKLLPLYERLTCLDST